MTVVYLGVVVYLATTTGDDLSGFDRRGRPAVTVSHGSEHRKCCIRFHSNYINYIGVRHVRSIKHITYDSLTRLSLRELTLDGG